MPPGALLEAEVDGASLFKIDILAEHYAARQTAKELLPNGHLLITLVKE
ncbi:MAG: hypothetical protein KKE73_15205 [Proteobacteria bacterium]|nr:hypothetical protein [Pseudomonadota bacterium]